MPNLIHSTNDREWSFPSRRLFVSELYSLLLSKFYHVFYVIPLFNAFSLTYKYLQCMFHFSTDQYPYWSPIASFFFNWERQLHILCLSRACIAVRRSKVGFSFLPVNILQGIIFSWNMMYSTHHGTNYVSHKQRGDIKSRCKQSQLIYHPTEIRLI